MRSIVLRIALLLVATAAVSAVIWRNVSVQPRAVETSRVRPAREDSSAVISSALVFHQFTRSPDLAAAVCLHSEALIRAIQESVQRAGNVRTNVTQGCTVPFAAGASQDSESARVDSLRISNDAAMVFLLARRGTTYWRERVSLTWSPSLVRWLGVSALISDVSIQ